MCRGGGVKKLKSCCGGVWKGFEPECRGRNLTLVIRHWSVQVTEVLMGKLKGFAGGWYVCMYVCCMYVDCFGQVEETEKGWRHV